jgi:hypothetical protein
MVVGTERKSIQEMRAGSFSGGAIQYQEIGTAVGGGGEYADVRRGDEKSTVKEEIGREKSGWV